MRSYRLEQHPNGKWYIYWTEGRRTKRKSTRQTDFRKAEILLASWRESPNRTTPLSTELTFAEAWSLYVDAKKAKNAGVKRNVSVGRYLNAAFGKIAVVDIKQMHVERFAVDRARGRIGTRVAPATIWYEIGVLIAAINFAVRKGLVPRDRRPKIERPDPPEPRDR